ncbi:MAG: PqiC family protein [Desulfobulbus sp.]|jgi:uncharacterized lipoprotein YmbA
MNNRPGSPHRQWPVLLCALLLCACIAPNLSAPTLHTLPTEQPQPISQAFAAFDQMVLLMPVRVAPYLEGRGLVTSAETGATTSSPSHIWAGPLDQQIGRRIVTDLQGLLATDNVALYPAPRFATIRYQVEVEINELSGDGRTFTTTAVYTLSDTAAKTVLARKTFRQSQVMEQADPATAVACTARGISALSREIATALVSAHQENRR